MPSRGAVPCLALLVTALGVAPPVLASAPIYKCLDNHLTLVYTDLPCKDGEALDVRAGDADPAAVARLEDERDALDRSADLRMQDERRAAMGAAGYVPFSPGDERDAQQEAAESPGYGYLGYPTYLRRPHHHNNRPAKQLLHARGGAPKPPYPIPRH